MPYLRQMTIDSEAGVIPVFSMGDRLRKARELTHLDQTEFGSRLGISRQSVSNAETDSVKVRRITINAWALHTGVPVEWLDTGTEPTTPDDGGNGLLSGGSEPTQEYPRRLLAVA